MGSTAVIIDAHVSYFMVWRRNTKAPTKVAKVRRRRCRICIKRIKIKFENY